MAETMIKPIQIQELFQLTNVGISPESISFNKVTMESSKYICIRETQQDSATTLVTIDLKKPTEPVRRSLTVDNAIMCPDQHILALRAGNQLQIFNLDMKTRLKACVMTEPIVFLKWIDNKTIGIVTANAVFHWVLDGPESPTKIFDRHSTLADFQIINYRSDSKGKWLCLVGISQKDGYVVGNMQLYSPERNQSQVIEGHACAFGNFTPDGANGPSTLFSFSKRTSTESKLYIIEIAKSDSNGPSYQKKAVDLLFTSEGGPDFPISQHISQKNNMLYIITKMGYIHIFHLENATLIYRNNISSETIFVTVPHEESGGILGIDRKGRVLLITLDEKTLIPYICNNLNNYELAMKLACKGELPGEDLLIKQFNRLFEQENYKEAAKFAAESPQGILRTHKTIELFQQLPTQPGATSPLLQYFSILLEKGQLNKIESIELSRPILQQGREQLLEKWLQEDKFTCSEELGDLIKPYNSKLALTVYFRAETHSKAILCFAERDEYDKIVPYAQKFGSNPDWNGLLIQMLQRNPEKAAIFAATLISVKFIDVNVVVDTFMARDLIQPTTVLLLEVLKENKPQDGPLQTKLLEINLIHAPQVADAILGNEMFSHYDRTKIGQLCEKVGLHQRALELIGSSKENVETEQNQDSLKQEISLLRSKIQNFETERKKFEEEKLVLTSNWEKEKNSLKEQINLLQSKIQKGSNSSENDFLRKLIGIVEIKNEDIVKEKEIGQGAFSIVFKGTWKNEQIVALKQFSKLNSEIEDKLKEEIAITKRLEHPNIVKLFGITKLEDKLTMILEFLDGGSLYHQLHVNNTKYSFTQQIELSIDIANGLTYLHSFHPKIIHRDLKSANILLNSKGQAKLTDFGLTQIKLDNSSVIGTHNWMAPEMFDSDAKINEKVDIYAFGMILYEISTNSIPFSELQPQQIIIDVLWNQRRPIIPDECNSNLRKIIDETWNQEPSKRPTIIQILAKLELLQ